MSKSLVSSKVESFVKTASQRVRAEGAGGRDVAGFLLLARHVRDGVQDRSRADARGGDLEILEAARGDGRFVDVAALDESAGRELLAARRDEQGGCEQDPRGFTVPPPGLHPAHLDHLPLLHPPIAKRRPF